MNARRTIIHVVAAAFAAAIAIYAAAPQTAFGQDPPASMARFGTVEIKDETEYQLFWSLLCRCGCPRETLGTCTCSTAHNMRGELRAELAAGRSVEDIKAAYAAKFGTDAVAVPPNKGSQRAVWILPLLAIVVGAGVVGVFLSRWVRRSASDDAKRAKEPAQKQTEADEKLDEKYDRRLDDELKALDKE
jgi:cytochrome c-type biogenesis protein CcmH